jgi:hypothetical protein
MLYKYELLCGSEQFEQKFDFYSPINPSTKKPYGAETQKFDEWAKQVRMSGKIPVHPSIRETAHEAYMQTMALGTFKTKRGAEDFCEENGYEVGWYAERLVP